MAEEQEKPADPSKPVSVAPPVAEKPGEEPEKPFDAKAAHEEMDKRVTDFMNTLGERVSKLEAAWDKLASDEENEGDAKLKAEQAKPEEKPNPDMDEVKSKSAEHSKKLETLAGEVSAMRKSQEELGTALAKHGFKKTVGSTGGGMTADEEIQADAKMRVKKYMG
jgi:hypothetical protein